MKKILILTISLFFLFQFFFVVEAKTQNDKGSGNKSEDYVSPSEAAKAKTASAKLNRILDVTEDPEVEEEVGDLVEEQEQVEERSQEVLDETEDRPAAVKFLIGPDYKNLGQLRKEVVQTRNNIKKLENEESIEVENLKNQNRCSFKNRFNQDVFVVENERRNDILKKRERHGKMQIKLLKMVSMLIRE